MLERAVEWLRPLVDPKVWVYVVVWKLGDDPSRFIEWMGCCCSGGRYTNVKDEVEISGRLCRDFQLVHPIRTKACEALSRFPSSMPLYSGIHGEVVMTNQPRWLDSDPANGTRVLIPVIGGIVELFAAEHVPKDQKIVEFVRNHCNQTSKQDFMMAQAYATEKIESYPPPVELFTNFIPNIQVIPTITQVNTHSTCGKTLGMSILSNDQLVDANYGHLFQNGLLRQPIYKPSASKKLKYKDYEISQDNNMEKKRRSNKESYQSKNLITERNRRKRIKDLQFALRALVPKISKMDKTAILEDAIQYINELQQEIKKLKDELSEIEEDNCKKDINADISYLISDELPDGTSHLCLTNETKDDRACIEQQITKVHVEVNQISRTEFLIKLLCRRKPGGVVRLVETINSLGLQVVDANITTNSGRVLNIMKLEAQKKEIHPANLRESLAKLRW